MADCRTPSLPDLPAGYRWRIKESNQTLQIQTEYKTIFGNLKWCEVASVEMYPSLSKTYADEVEYAADYALQLLNRDICKKKAMQEINGA